MLWNASTGQYYKTNDYLCPLQSVGSLISKVNSWIQFYYVKMSLIKMISLKLIVVITKLAPSPGKHLLQHPTKRSSCTDGVPNIRPQLMEAHVYPISPQTRADPCPARFNTLPRNWPSVRPIGGRPVGPSTEGCNYEVATSACHTMEQILLQCFEGNFKRAWDCNVSGVVDLYDSLLLSLSLKRKYVNILWRMYK